jgi:hypothetical protein
LDLPHIQTQKLILRPNEGVKSTQEISTFKLKVKTICTRKQELRPKTKLRRENKKKLKET